MTNPNSSLQDILNTLSTFTQPQNSFPPGHHHTPGFYPQNGYAQPQVLPHSSNHVELKEEYEPPDDYDPLDFNPESFSTTAAAAAAAPNPDSRHPTTTSTSQTARSSKLTPTFYDPSQPLNQAQAQPEPQVRLQPQPRSGYSPPLTHPSPPPRSRPAVNDPTRPSTITSWSPAMTFVRTSLLSSPSSITILRKHIANQAFNERQWWAGREKLLLRHRGRETRRNEINDMLRAMGGKVGETSGREDEKRREEEEREMQEELQRYDVKVHRAVGQMVQEGERELRALGVPFFCTRGELVREGEGEGGGGGGERGEETISRETLRRLQRRMLDYLQVSCQE